MSIISSKSKIALFLVPLFMFSLGIFTSRAEKPSGTPYYSIHLASFKSLQNANKFVNSLKNQGKIVFWKEADIIGKGLFYRVYLGKYDNRDMAVTFWEALKKEGAVSYFGVHAFTESRLPEIAGGKRPGMGLDLTAHMPPESPVKQPAEIRIRKRKTVPYRFQDNGDGTVTDHQTGLMWIKNGWRIDFFAAMKLDEALEKLKTFRHAGHADWRLPSIREWMRLIDKKKQYPALASPNPFVNIVVHMPYWSGTDYVYRLNREKDFLPSMEMYTVMLYAGTVHHQKKTERALIMPVRSLY